MQEGRWRITDHKVCADSTSVMRVVQVFVCDQTRDQVRKKVSLGIDTKMMNKEMKPMKKWIAFFLAIVMISGVTTVPAFALETETYRSDETAEQMVSDYTSDAKIQKTIAKTVERDFAYFKQAYLEDGLTIYDVNPDGSITYAIRFDDENIDYVKVEKNDSGDITFFVTEGDLQNELTYMADGRLILDGHEIEIYFDDDLGVPLSVPGGEVAQPMAGVKSTLTAILLSVKSDKSGLVMPSGFSATSSVYNGPYISMGQFLADTTLLVIKAAIIKDVKVDLVAYIQNIPINIMSSILDTALTKADSRLSQMRADNPNSSTIRFKAKTYAKSGNNSLYAEWIYEFAVYGNASMTGTPAYASAKKVIEAT